MPNAILTVALAVILVTGIHAAEVQYVDVTHEGVAVRASVVPTGATLALTSQVFPTQGSNAADQLKDTLEQLGALLKKVGGSVDSIARINLYAATPEAAAEARGILAKQLKCPVSAVVSTLPQSGALVALDAVAVATVDTSSDPANVRLLKSNRAVYISGMAAEGDMAAATRETLEKLGGVLEFLRLDRKDVVHVKSFLQGATDVSASKAELAKFFDGNPPPAVWVEWTMKSPIEIELIAQESGRIDRDVADTVTYLTPPDVKPSPLYSRIAMVHGGRMIYTSGVYAGAATADGVAETRLALATLRELIQKAGGDFDHLVKATYHPSAKSTDAGLNQIRPEFYNPKRPPAASKATAPHTGDAESELTLDLIAVTPK